MIKCRCLPRPLLLLFFSLSLSLAARGQIRTIQTDVQHDVSLPLRDLARSAPFPAIVAPEEAEPLRVIPLPPGFKPASEPDAVLQQKMAAAPDALAPTMGLNFNGIGQGVAGFNIQFVPPDTNGAVGLGQYVQWVNTAFAVFDKTTGNIIMGPTLGKALWQGFGGACETNNDGDPIVTYDKLNDRWIFGQFAVRGSSGFLTNTLQCIAVSTSSDATDSYNRYSFQYNNEIDDYPKMGVWPDAYYATFNMFDSVTTVFLGADACAYDGNAMRNGLPATQVCFQQASSVGGLLPSDVDGHTQPPAGSPDFMLNFGVNSLNLFKFHVDFTTPANSTFTGPTVIPVSAFTPLCNGGSSCVPQQGTATQLDSLADRLMYRLAYRNFGDHESLVVNHSVAGSSGGSGIRWYELQDPNGTPSVLQQATLAPDSNFRWMGSIAMDVSGDLAVGYSVSSSTMFPSIAMAGRTSSDPPGTLEPEISIVSGAGSQNSNRWGDYSAMQVDPIDDCTFWYTTQYLQANGSFNWNTRIVNFKFPRCTLPDLAIASTHSGNFFPGQMGATYTISVSNVGTQATVGGTLTVSDLLPFGEMATAVGGSGWACFLVSSTNINCTRPAGALRSGSSYPPITLTVNVGANVPPSMTNSASLSGISDANLANNSSSDVTTITPLTITPTPNAPVTVTAGTVGTFNFTASLTLNVGAVTFTANGLPPNSKATFSPVTVTQTGSVSMTVDTSGGGHVAALRPSGGLDKFSPYFAGLFGLFALLWIRTGSGQIRRRVWMATCCCALALFVALVGCGGGGGPPPPPPITPSGTYTITVMAASSNVSVSPVTAQVTLVVK
ncbi:MAG TPA: hypothetical protein VI636_04480 [Candidatus Angelobacter sp.]